VKDEGAARKKILFITHIYYPSVGGAERVFQRIAEGLSLRGHAVTVLTSDALSTEQFFTGAHNDLPPYERLNGVWVIRESIRSPLYRVLKIFDRAGRVTGRLGVFFRPLVFGPHFTRTFREVGRGRFDAVIAGPVPTSATFYAVFYKGKHPFSHLILFPHMHTRDRLHTTFVNLWVLRRADHVIALSEAEKNYLARRGVRRKRLFRLVNAVDEPILQAPKTPAWSDMDYVLYLGQEGGHKRIPLLVRAMQSLWDKGLAPGLVIAGARTNFSPELDRIIGALPAPHKDKISRFNDISESRKIALLDNCLVLVNPSSFEAFGLVFLEAWARRKPVIGARIDAVREVIRDGENGFLFEDKSVADLEEKIRIILDDRSRAEKMGEAGYEDVLAKYRWEAVIRRVESVLQKKFH